MIPPVLAGESTAGDRFVTASSGEVRHRGVIVTRSPEIVV